MIPARMYCKNILTGNSEPEPDGPGSHRRHIEVPLTF